ncbi:MAG: hypothetical protein WCT14_19915 [Treponemataceae bacterium]
MKRIITAPRALFVLFFTLFCLTAAFATETSLNVMAAYYIPHHWGYQETGFASPNYSMISGASGQRDLGSTWGGAEAKAAFSISERVPFFVGEGPLFSGNSIKGKFTFELSPVSVNGIGQISFTPIAFLVFDTGAGIGTGWSIGPFRGLGLNLPTGDDIDLTNFGGAVWGVWGAGTFQFDFAAVAPGQWNHIVLLATAKVEYKAFTGATADQAWLWEADQADNFNGAKFLSTFVLAYQMPLKLNLVGVLFESEEYLGSVREKSTIASGGWGSDFRILQVGALANIELGKKDSLAVLGQFKLRPDWTDATTQSRYFGFRVYEGAYWYFNRVAFSYTHTF